MNKGLKRLIPRVALITSLLFTIGVILSLFAIPAMAADGDDYYWAGGTGNWSDVAHWSATDDGTGGDFATPPNATNDVFFTANSAVGAGQEVRVDAASYCLDMDWTGQDDNMTLTGTGVLNAYGSVTLISGMTYSLNLLYLYPAGNEVLTTAGKTLKAVGKYGAGKITLADALNCGAGGYQLILSAGELATANFAVTCNPVVISGASAKTLTPGSSTISCSDWNYSGSNLTLAANTATINVSGSGQFAGGNIATYNTINLNGTSHTVSGAFTCATLRRTGTATKTDTLTMTSGTTVTATNFAVISNSATNRVLVQSSTLGTAGTITATNQAFSNADFIDITLSTAYNPATSLLTNTDFETGDPPTGWTLVGAGATVSRSNVQAHGGTYSALLTRNGTNAILKQDVAGGFTVYQGMPMTLSGWAWASVNNRARFEIGNGVVGTLVTSYHTGDSTWQLLTANVTMPTNATECNFDCEVLVGDTAAYFDDVSLVINGTIGDCGGNTGITFTPAVAQTWNSTTGSWSDSTKWTSRVPLPQDDVSAGGAGNTITVDMPRLGKSVTFSGTPTVSLSNVISVFGSYTLTSGMTYTHNSNNEQFSGRGAFTITSASKSLYRVVVQAPSGTYSLGSDRLAGTVTDRLIAGTLNLNGYNYTTGFFSDNASTLTKVLTLGSGTFTLDGTTAAKWTFNAINSTLNANASTIILTNSGVTGQTFAGGGLTYNNVTIQGAGNYKTTFTGSNTFNVLKIDASAASKTLTLTDTTVQTVAQLQRDNAGTNIITINGTGAAGWGITKTNNTPNSLDYLNLDYSTGLPVSTWFAGANSTDGTHNTNWTFNDPVFTVTTNACTGVTMNKDAVTGGVFHASLPTAIDGSPAYEYWFEYGLTALYGNSTGHANIYSSVIFSDSIPINLTPGQTYHCRAAALNASGTYYGADVTFVFTLPTVTTQAASNLAVTNVGVTSGLFNGNVTNLGVASSAYTNVEWGLTNAYGSTTASSTVNAIGAFTIALPNYLIPGQTYHYRVNTLNGAVVSHGGDQTFIMTNTTSSASGSNNMAQTIIPIISVVIILVFAIGFLYAGATIPGLLMLAVGILIALGFLLPIAIGLAGLK